MFKTQNGERSAKHKNDYARLLTGYARVHAWAGHTHATHNFVYPSGHMYAGVEVQLSICDQFLQSIVDAEHLGDGGEIVKGILSHGLTIFFGDGSAVLVVGIKASPCVFVHQAAMPDN